MSSNTYQSEGQARRDPSGDEGGEGLTTVFQSLTEQADHHEKVSVGSLLEAFSHRGFAPLLLIPAVIIITPLGAIPGISVTAGAIYILIGGQILFGRNHPWLPGRLLRMTLPAQKLRKIIEKSLPVTRFVDRLLAQRMEYMTRGVYGRAGGLLCVLMGLLMFPLALMPIGVAAPSAAVAVYSLGLVARDGAFVTAAYLLGGVSVGVAFWLGGIP
ncbi:exopolysaccharide biosynthesis protein [Minwuia thermotolerans]|uniref:ABC transporter permease n=1 Tax=Minwuia thermotolerans TaxID=2056226 RepID=A0A2M9G720_9PROT|nr:exopolysaccharide biosynthesis protein [Minwuia thermotolerans]PJK31518.1 ABC transporter permease [Minwuia thermotolerans]